MVIKDRLTTCNQSPFASAIHWDALHGTATSPSTRGGEEADLAADVIERLEVLDDVIFAAIDGDPEALDAAAATWQGTLEELGQETVEESRQQYLRCAKSAWEAARQNPEDRDPLAAIEIIGLLVNVEW